MSTGSMSRACYRCRYRGSVPGDAHSCCRHPLAQGAFADPFASVLAIFASVGRSAPQIHLNAVELGIQAADHGIRNGWFNWPWNFDPVWLEHCDGFEAKDEEVQ